MRVSMGVLPTSLTKKSCSITEAETVRREGSLRRSFPNLVGWLGYWVRQYSSRAHWDFSCSCSMVPESDKLEASEEKYFEIFFKNILLPRTCCEQNNGLHTTKLGNVHVKGLELLDLLLEYPDVVHEGDHPVGRHGAGVEAGSCQEGGDV